MMNTYHIDSTINILLYLFVTIITYQSICQFILLLMCVKVCYFDFTYKYVLTFIELHKTLKLTSFSDR